MLFVVVLLLSAKANAQLDIVAYPNHFITNPDMPKIYKEIRFLLRYVYTDNNGGVVKRDKKVKNVSIYEDRIEFKLRGKNIVMKYSEVLVKNTITFIDKSGTRAMTAPAVQKAFENYQIGGPMAQTKIGNYVFYTYTTGNIETVRYLGLHFFTIQYQMNIKRLDSLLTAFKPVAEEYIRLTEKPVLNEEHRKYIIQANSCSDRQEYPEAIVQYEKLTDEFPTVYPDAYSNMAFLSAQINRFDMAVFYMKKYIMLLPDAEDARSAQDNIYKWELFLKQ